jgi:hypothetical protein
VGAVAETRTEEAFVFGLLKPVDRGDVGVIERRQELGFALEAGHSFGIACERLGKELERDLSIQIKVIGQLDFAHASAAKLFTNSIMS